MIFEDHTQQKLRTTLQETILEAGELAMKFFRSPEELQVRHKSRKDLVTEADLQVEELIKKRCLGDFPEFSFFGEESGIVQGKGGEWIVDPIDGTHSFARGQYFWSISIALRLENDIILGAVYAPALRDLYFAEKGKGSVKNGKPVRVSECTVLEEAMVGTGFACLRAGIEDNNLARFKRVAEQTMGQRRFGSAAMDLCMVADGQLDAFWEQELNLYDIAAGVLIVQEAGGSITDFQGNNLINPSQVLATNGKLLSALLPLM